MDRKFKKKTKSGHRLFMGFFPNKEVRDQIRDIQRAISRFDYKLRFVNVEQAHLTIKFLGNNVSAENANYLMQEITKHKSQLRPLTLKTEGIQFGFQKGVKPQIVFLKIEMTPELIDFAEYIQELTKRVGLKDVVRRKDRQKFIGHITIARVKKDISNSFVKEVDAELEKFPFEPIEFKAEYLHLVESTLSKKGPIYRNFLSLDMGVKSDQTGGSTKP